MPSGGDIQHHQPYSALAMLCNPGAANSASTGMLVVDSIVPGSFAEGLLEPGDIITQVQGKVVTHFLALEDTLDSSVGATVTLLTCCCCVLGVQLECSKLGKQLNI